MIVGTAPVECVRGKTWDYANTVGVNFVQERERIIRQQQEAIRELSTPVLQVRERLLLLPLIGGIYVVEAASEPSPVRAPMGPGWERVSAGMVETEAGPLLVIDVAALIGCGVLTGVGGGVLGIGVNRVPVAAERADADILVLELLLPRLGFPGVGQQLGDRAMGGIRVASRSDLHCLEAQGGNLLEHLLQRQLGIGRVKDANRDFLLLVSCFAGQETRCGCRLPLDGGNCSYRGRSHYGTCRSKKSTPAHTGPPLSTHAVFLPRLFVK